MAKNNDSKPSGNDQDKVTAILKKCAYKECRGKEERAGFCHEHFAWFKGGLLTKDGHKPRDFDKKYIAFKKRKAA